MKRFIFVVIHGYPFFSQCQVPQYMIWTHYLPLLANHLLSFQKHQTW